MAGSPYLGAPVVTGGTQTLRVGQPGWLRHPNGPKRQYPTLTGRHAADVAVVGGGMTGARGPGICIGGDLDCAA
jgi:hypothetical protein